MGAEVIQVVRPGPAGFGSGGGRPEYDLLARGRRSVGIDLKLPEGVDALLRLVETADGLFEGFRPGVMERLGLGPDVCRARNPRLVYGRMTGFGQEGPLAQAAGHDINYIALAGALAHMGRSGQPPVPPLNLVGDFGGGGLLLAFGMVCALLERTRSGPGSGGGRGDDRRRRRADDDLPRRTAVRLLERHARYEMLDTGAPSTTCTNAPTGSSLDRIDRAAVLREAARADRPRRRDSPGQLDRAGWPQLRERFRALFKTRTRDEGPCCSRAATLASRRC